LVGILAYNWIVTTALGMNKVLSMMSVVVAGQFLALTPICVPVVDRDFRRCGCRRQRRPHRRGIILILRS